MVFGITPVINPLVLGLTFFSLNLNARPLLNSLSIKPVKDKQLMVGHHLPFVILFVAMQGILTSYIK